jgi:AcrR family transcriptional regulator
MIMERGPAAFSIDALVVRTGVAKTTVYRHWPSRRELMAAVFSNMTQMADAPNTGTLRSDLREFFMRGVRAMRDSRWDQHMQTLPGIIEAAQRDPDLSNVGIRVLESTVQSLMPMLRRARVRGEIRTDVGLEAVAHILLGATFIHRALDYGLNEHYIVEVIGAVLDGISSAPRLSRLAVNRSARPPSRPSGNNRRHGRMP